MPVILFVDMLGARRKWETGGVAGATAAFQKFARLVVAAVKEESASIVEGGVDRWRVAVGG